MVELVAGRRPEGRDLAALRIDAVENALDGTVLAGGVHALKDQEQRPLVLRIEPLLQIVEALFVGLKNFLARLLVEAAPLAGPVGFEMKCALAVEPKWRDERAEPPDQGSAGLPGLRGFLAHRLYVSSPPPERGRSASCETQRAGRGSHVWALAISYRSFEIRFIEGDPLPNPPPFRGR